MSQESTSIEGWRPANVAGFLQHIGPLLRSTREEGADTYALQTDERHVNPIGLIHGGVLTSLLDQVIAITAWNAAGRKPTVTVQMETRFLGSARAGDLLTCRARIRQATRSLIFADADVTCREIAVASASAIMKTSGKAKLNP